MVVLGKGATRTAIVRALRDLGLEVTTASDPFGATASFAVSPANLVVASLAGWRRRDAAFLTTARARAKHTAVIALVPATDRRMALAALEAGADIFLPEPVDLDELTAVVSRLLSRSKPAPDGDAAGALRALCADMGHAVNNPLQVASLLLEDPRASLNDVRAGVAKELRRIQATVAQVTAFGRLSPPAPTLVPLARSVVTACAAVGRETPLAPLPPGFADDRTSARVDEAQVVAALEAAVRFLAARSPARPVPLRVALSAKSPAVVDVLLRVGGVVISDDEALAALSAVLDVDEHSRETRAGLGLSRAIVRAHGGTMAWRRPSDPAKGTLLRIRWPR